MGDGKIKDVVDGGAVLSSQHVMPCSDHLRAMIFDDGVPSCWYKIKFLLLLPPFNMRENQKKATGTQKKFKITML